MKSLLKIGVSDVIISVTAVAVILLMLLPVGRALSILPVLLAAYIVPCAVYRYSRYYSSVGQLSLSIAFVMMSIFFALNLWQSTVHLGSVEAPMLLYDPFSFHRLAQDFANGTYSAYSPVIPYNGYSIFLSWWMMLGVEDIAYPTVVNIFVLLVTLLLVGRCVVFVVGDKPYTTRMVGYAMMLTAVIPGVMGTGTVLSKDPSITMSFLLCVNALYAIKQRYRVGLYAAMLVIGLIILAATRPTYIYILLLFVAAIWLYRMTKRDIVPMCVILAVIMLAIYVGVNNSWFGDSYYVACYLESQGHDSFSYGDSQKPLHQLLGDYNAYTLPQKLLVLPITTAVQFMIPFPFSTQSDVFGVPLSSAYHRMSYLWYMAALPIFLFYLLHWWRKGCDTKLSLMALVSAMAYCVPALITGGVVSRYAFCFAPLLTVMGGYVLAHIATYNKWQKRVGVAFAVSYILLLSAALLVGANPSIIL